MDHLRCAAFELPFQAGEAFGRNAGVEEMLSERGVVTVEQAPGESDWLRATGEQVTDRRATKSLVRLGEETRDEELAVGQPHRFHRFHGGGPHAW